MLCNDGAESELLMVLCHAKGQLDVGPQSLLKDDVCKLSTLVFCHLHRFDEGKVNKVPHARLIVNVKRGPVAGGWL